MNKELITKRETLMAGKNYNGIDLAKFICSILVIMIHVPPFGTSEDPAVTLLNYGVQGWLSRIAVPVFFVCSGYFLYKKTTIDSFSSEASKRYLLRLLKLYVIWTLIYFPLKFRAFFRDPQGLIHAVLTYCRDCVFTGSYTQLWYLPALMFAVLLTSCLLSGKIKFKYIILFSGLTFLLGLLAQSWFGVIRPLKTSAPVLWRFLKTVQKVMVTTRNGLFDGFVFVNIGALFAFYDLNISKKRSLIGFLVSMALMFAEAFYLKKIGFVRARDMYLFLLPAAFFCFAFIRQIELPDKPVYSVLRRVSSLVFFSHLWINSLAKKGLQLIDGRLTETPALFVVTAVFSVLLSFAIVRLSDQKRFQWLKHLYS